jgi:hypothetical protein
MYSYKTGIPRPDDGGGNFAAETPIPVLVLPAGYADQPGPGDEETSQSSRDVPLFFLSTREGTDAHRVPDSRAGSFMQVSC